MLGKVKTPLNEKLQNVKWGEFRLGELFEIENTLSFNTDKLVLGEQFDYVTRTSQNQGILQKTGFVNSQNINQAGNWSLGLLQMDFFYRKNPWYAGQFVRKVIPKINFNNKVIPFLTSALNKLKPTLLSVLVRDVDKTFLNLKLALPTTKNNTPDFDFMEALIADLERANKQKVKSYLAQNGLLDCSLTDKERLALEAYNNVQWGMFKLGDLFDVKTPKKRFDANKVTLLENSGGYPYVVRVSSNNGYKGFIAEDKNYLNEGNTISFGQDTATIYYQKEPYFTGDKIKVLKAKDNKFNHKNAQFFISAMSKTFSSFSWGSTSFSVNILEKQKLSLPITTNNTPDYDFMDTLITALHKLMVKNVVRYVEKVS